MEWENYCLWYLNNKNQGGTIARATFISRHQIHVFGHVDEVYNCMVLGTPEAKVTNRSKAKEFTSLQDRPTIQHLYNLWQALTTFRGGNSANAYVLNYLRAHIFALSRMIIAFWGPIG